jgi:archaellum component FlaC
MPDFTAQTSEVLEEEISKLLGGVGTAFYVSIYGIFLSIWWILFEKSGMSGFDKDAKIIKSSTKDYFWQKEEIEQTYFRKSMENFEKLNSVFDTFSSENFLKDLNETLVHRVNVFENIISHEQEGARKIANIISNSTNHLEKLYEEQASLVGSLHEITSQFKDFAQNIKKQNDTFNEAHDALSSEFSRAVMMAEVLSENSIKIGDSLSAVNAKNVEKLYSDMLKNIEALGTTFDERMERFDSRFLDKLQNALNMIDSETAQIVSHLSKLDNR